MRVLVTGAGGFVGRRTAAALAARGCAVTAAYRSAPPPESPGVSLLRADLSTPAGIAALPDRMDAVVHFAATSPGPGIDAARLVRDNLGGFDALLSWAAAAGVRRFVFASSLSLYGRGATGEVDETTPSIDPDIYGTTKRLGEAMLAGRAGGLAGLALRLPGIVGPGCRANFLSGTVRRLVTHQPVTAYNPDSPFNNVVHVDELASFVAGLLDRSWTGFDAVTLGASGSTTIRDALERLARGVGSSSAITFALDARPTFTVSNRRAVERYGYAPSDVGVLLDRYAAEERAAADVADAASFRVKDTPSTGASRLESDD